MTIDRLEENGQAYQDRFKELVKAVAQQHDWSPKAKIVEELLLQLVHDKV